MTLPVNKAPRWRGFNLLEKFAQKRGLRPFREEDFAFLAEWGFDFARLPMTYMAWTREDDLYALLEGPLGEIDQAVEFGRQYGIHVCISFHRAPGFSVNGERKEPFSLWKDAAALDCCTFHWRHFARRYQGVPPERLSFNLWNEPEEPGPRMSREDHERVARHVVAAIRAIDPARPIVADGVHWGAKPLPELADLDVIQSCRGYHPVEVTHYRADWNDPGCYPLPTWPYVHQAISRALAKVYRGNTSVNLAPRGSDRAHLENSFYRPWMDLMARGVGVHCGEMGCYNRTPHAVALAWMKDVLDVLTERHIGFALWNFRGPFGILDSERDDVAYEDYRGHKLDRAMLELLQQYR